MVAAVDGFPLLLRKVLISLKPERFTCQTSVRYLYEYLEQRSGPF